MTITKEQVFETCKIIAPVHQFDPLLIQAVCLQEGGRNKDGTFAPNRARLENGFYSRYVEKNDWATTSEILFAASYGVMQTMGLELLRMGFFEFYFNQCSAGLKAVLKTPRSQFAIPSGIDAFCENINWQIEFGCKLMAEKRKSAKGDIPQMLLNWNGGSNKNYPIEVLAKLEKLKA